MQAGKPLDFRQVAAKGAFWVYAAQYSGKLVALISTVILARLLSKDDFGVIGYALIVTNFLDVLKDLGVGTALVYHRKDPAASATAFWLLVMVGGGLFGLSWVIAPYLGEFFRDQRAVPVIRALALTFPISSLGIVHRKLLDKDLAFKRTFGPSLARSVSKGLLSIVFALLNFKVWSLVIGNIGGVLVMTLVLWVIYPWRPSMQFDRKIARELVSYGSGILSINVIAFLLRDLDSIFIGRFMSADALGVYSLAYRVPDILIISFCGVISRVTFPIYVQMRETSRSLEKAFLSAFRYISWVTVPMGLGLTLVAKPFVLTFFSEKWLEAVPVLQAISIYAMFFSFSYNAGSVYKATGRPFLLTKLAVFRLVLLIIVLYLAVTQIGTIVSVGWAHAFVALVAGSLNLYVASKILKLPLVQLFHEIRTSLASALGMSLVVGGVLFATAQLSPFGQLFLAVAAGGAVYLALLGYQEREESRRLFKFIQQKVRRV